MQLTQEEGGGAGAGQCIQENWLGVLLLPFFYRRIYCSVAAAAGVDLASFL
jgi:hypothetical protein